MATFVYTAIGADGKQVKSTIEADNQQKASEQLRKDGMTIVSLAEGSTLNKDINISGLIKKKVKNLK